MNNKKEFVERVQRYETISLKEIKEEWLINDDKNGHYVAQALTGFGRNNTCTICRAVNSNCNICVYGGYYGCISNKNVDTYNGINNAETPRQLLNRFRKRAKHMRETYKELFL